MNKYWFILPLTLLTCFYTSAQTKNAKYEAYIAKYYKLAMEKQKKHNIPASITLAQALLESGAGESKLAQSSNNHFGIKCGSNWYGKKVYFDDDQKGECFRSYPNVSDSYDDHSAFLKRQRYAFLFDYDILDYKAWANGLRQAGYATDPNYPKKLIGIIELYQLNLYDEQAAGRAGNHQTDLAEETSSSDNSFDYVVTENNHRRCIKLYADDSMKKIAKQMNIPLKMLLYFNDMPKSMPLKQGDYVYLQMKRSHTDKDINNHTVKAGESMFSISQLYGIKLKNLYKINDMTYGKPAEEGMILKLHQ